MSSKLGRLLARLLPEAAKEYIRAYYFTRYGACCRCGAVLGGQTPSQICETCHADAILGRGLRGRSPGGCDA